MSLVLTWLTLILLMAASRLSCSTSCRCCCNCWSFLSWGNILTTSWSVIFPDNFLKTKHLSNLCVLLNQHKHGFYSTIFLVVVYFNIYNFKGHTVLWYFPFCTLLPKFLWKKMTSEASKEDKYQSSVCVYLNPPVCWCSLGWTETKESLISRMVRSQHRIVVVPPRYSATDRQVTILGGWLGGKSGEIGDYFEFQ